jgi:dephospho-CoA kinase
VWLVTCDPDRQFERLLGRGLNQAEATQRIAAQDDPARRLAPAATRVIDTSGDTGETRRLVLDAWAASGAG